MAGSLHAPKEWDEANGARFRARAQTVVRNACHAPGACQNRSVARSSFALPPLELLVAFEAAARHLSFTRAASEVALTQSAVSRQIQSLEADLGVPLFRRLHRSLSLTDEGRALHAATAEALGRLDRATRELKREGKARAVVVTTTPGFAGLWLIPRLASFVAANPGVDVRISASTTLADLDHDGVDLAIRYQAVDAQFASSTLLFRRDRHSRLQAPSCAAPPVPRSRCPPISPDRPCCAWPPTASTSCAIGTCGCRPCTWPICGRPAPCTSPRMTS